MKKSEDYQNVLERISAKQNLDKKFFKSIKQNFVYINFLENFAISLFKSLFLSLSSSLAHSIVLEIICYCFEEKWRQIDLEILENRTKNTEQKKLKQKIPIATIAKIENIIELLNYCCIVFFPFCNFF